MSSSLKLGLKKQSYPFMESSSLGGIVPFFGLNSDIPATWTLCVAKIPFSSSNFFSKELSLLV